MSEKWKKSLLLLSILCKNMFAKCRIMDKPRTINRIKVVLAEKQRTNKWLAEAVGKSVNTVSRWCGNKIQPHGETLVEIAKVLEVEVGELFNKTK